MSNLRSRKPIKNYEFEAEKGVGEWEKLLAASKPLPFLSQLQQGDILEWIKKLDNKGEEGGSEEDLYAFLTSTLTSSIVEATDYLFDEVLCPTPLHIANYFSGNENKAVKLRFEDSRVFIAHLFHRLKLSSPVPIRLCGWDLYHAHYFVHYSLIDDKNEERKKIKGELGMLFHAKEFPKEMGGEGDNNSRSALDPRYGSEISINDPDYPLRNYLYLLSTDSFYLFDPLHPEFPNSLIKDNQYFTVSEDIFTSLPLGNINYFPHLNAPDIKFVEDGNSEVIDYKAASQNILCSPVHLSPSFPVKNLLYKLYNVISGFDQSDLTLLQKELSLLAQPTDLSSPSAILSLPSSLTYISSLIEQRNADKKKEIELQNAKVFSTMVYAMKYRLNEAKTALTLTADEDGRYFQYRADSMIKILYSRCRTQSLLALYPDDVSEEDALFVWKKAGDPEACLEAIHLARSTSISLSSAVDQVIQKLANLALEDDQY